MSEDAPIDVTNNPAPLGRLSGDWTDDDGIYIDQQFEGDPQGPQPRTGLEPEKETIRAATRILSQRMPVGTLNGTLADPVMAFPADLNRKTLIVIATGGTVSIGSDKSDVYNGVVMPANLPWTTDNHTGSVWLHSTSETAVTVSVWSITV